MKRNVIRKFRIFFQAENIYIFISLTDTDFHPHRLFLNACGRKLIFFLKTSASAENCSASYRSFPLEQQGMQTAAVQHYPPFSCASFLPSVFQAVSVFL